MIDSILVNRFDTARLANLASYYIRNRDRRALPGLPLLTINDIVGACAAPHRLKRRLLEQQQNSF